MALIDTGSLLILTPISGQSAPELAPFSARDLTYTLNQVAGSGKGGNALGTFIRETVDGRTINLTPPWMRKYESTVTCADIHAPYIDGAFRGVICSVQCPFEFTYHTSGTPVRPVVSGSERQDGHVMFYRPELTMMVTEIRFGFEEWKARYAWQIDLREVQTP